MEAFLIQSLQGAGDGKAVQATAYALMVLLQRVCHCNRATPADMPIWRSYRDRLKAGENPEQLANTEFRRLSRERRSAITLWSGLQEATRNAVRPYLTLSAELPVAQAWRRAGARRCAPPSAP